MGSNDSELGPVLFKFLEDFLRKSGIGQSKMNVGAFREADDAIVSEFGRIGEDIGFIGNPDHGLLHLSVQGIGGAVAMREANA